MKKHFLFLIATICTLSSFSQKSWTLQECINRAKEENLDIKQAKLSVLSSEQQLLQSKLSLFPSLNGGGSQGYNYGRTVDPYSNEFTNLNVKTGFQNDKYIQIMEGISDSDVVIVGPYSLVSKTLKDGTKVESKKSGNDGEKRKSSFGVKVSTE